nr:hypothetical protein HmN_000981900 [Hymenolepis microstoma]
MSEPEVSTCREVNQFPLLVSRVVITPSRHPTLSATLMVVLGVVFDVDSIRDRPSEDEEGSRTGLPFARNDFIVNSSSHH